MQGANPEVHFAQEALHCECHQVSEEEHIDHSMSAFPHSLVPFMSWQVTSQSACGANVLVDALMPCVVTALMVLVVVDTGALEVVHSRVLVLISSDDAGADVLVVEASLL